MPRVKHFTDLKSEGKSYRLPDGFRADEEFIEDCRKQLGINFSYKEILEKHLTHAYNSYLALESSNENSPTFNQVYVEAEKLKKSLENNFVPEISKHLLAALGGELRAMRPDSNATSFEKGPKLQAEIMYAIQIKNFDFVIMIIQSYLKRSTIANQRKSNSGKNINCLLFNLCLIFEYLTGKDATVKRKDYDGRNDDLLCFIKMVTKEFGLQLERQKPRERPTYYNNELIYDASDDALLSRLHRIHKGYNWINRQNPPEEYSGLAFKYWME